MSFSSPRSNGRSVVEQSISIHGETITYALQRSIRRRHTIQLQADPETGFKLLVPHTMSDSEIEKFLQNRSDWIMKHREIANAPKEKKHWENGDTTQLRGNPVEVVISERDYEDPRRDYQPTLEKTLEQDRVMISIPPDLDDKLKSKIVRNLLKIWHRQEAKDDFETRIEQFGNLMGVKPRRIQVRQQHPKKRWGSCSYQGSINLNWQLIKLPERVIDYVVVHELAHIIELNHSANFWREVGNIIPEYRELRRELRKYSPATGELI